MKWLLVSAGVLVGLAAAPAARSQTTEQTFLVPTAGSLAQLCGDMSPNDPMMTAAQNFCHGYMVGAYQVLVQVNAARKKPAFCAPTPAPTRNQAIAAYVQWVDADPTKAAMAPADSVYAFLMQRWPCPAGK